MYKAIVFDMDGTLLNSDALVYAIYQEFTRRYPPKGSIKSVSSEMLLSYSYKDVLKVLSYEPIDFYLPILYEIYHDIKHQYLLLFPNVKEMLQKIKTLGLKIGLLTSELKVIAYDELKTLKIDHYFDCIVSFDDVVSPKPDSEGMEIIKEQFGYSKDLILYIGDQQVDALTAKTAGVESGYIVRHQSSFQNAETLFDNVFQNEEDLFNFILSKNDFHTLRRVNQTFKIIQFTDLHLMDNEKDEITYRNIRKMAWDENPDLIVFTGDQTMSLEAKILYEKLGKVMDELKIPFTYVFGNHDAENGVSYESLNHSISKSRFLLFSAGPKNLGYSNFYLEVRNECNHLEKVLIFMDSHQEDMYLIDDKKVWGYASISSDQMKWYENIVKKYSQEDKNSTSILFMHIPLPEYKDVKNEIRSSLQGDYNEQPSTAPINTGFFERIKKLNHSKAIFCGHDHLNDIFFMKDDIMLAYGRVSGQYDYAMEGFPKGVRIIEFHNINKIQTRIRLF